MARGGEVKKIGDLFKKYKENLKAPQATVIDGFIDIVREVLDIEIHKHQCSYSPQTQTLALTISGPAKSEVLFRKDEILEKLSKKIGVKSTPKQII